MLTSRYSVLLPLPFVAYFSNDCNGIQEISHCVYPVTLYMSFRIMCHAEKWELSWKRFCFQVWATSWPPTLLNFLTLPMLPWPLFFFSHVRTHNILKVRYECKNFLHCLYWKRKSGTRINGSYSIYQQLKAQREKNNLQLGKAEQGQRAVPASAFTERQREKIKGLFFLQLSTILESADTNLITRAPFCSRALQQAINQYLRSHC